MATHHAHPAAHRSQARHDDGPPEHAAHYGRLIAMVALSFLAMYALMYAMVDMPGNVFNNLNQAYMAGLMAAPMLLIELALMRAMYPRRTLNVVLAVAGVLAMLLCWFGIRQQAGITDQQFLRSMIPHHAGALLMCEQHHLSDPELQRLCDQIVASQQREIDLMKSRLE